MILLAYVIPYLVTFVTTTIVMRVLLDPIEGFDDTLDYFNINDGDL